MCGSGAGISMAPPAASAAAAGSAPQPAALSPAATASTRTFASPTTADSGSPAVHESGTEEQVRRMKMEAENLQEHSDKSLNQIMQKVRAEVFERSKGAQTPGEYNQLFEEFFLSNKN